MRSGVILALGLMFAGTWPHDGARGQTSIRPPVSIAPPYASPAPNPAADYDGFSTGVSDDNDTELASRCERAGLLVAPGSEWFPAEPAGPFLRLNYSGPNPGAFPDAARILGDALETGRA